MTEYSSPEEYWMAQAKELAARLAEAERDAARYRWLRRAGQDGPDTIQQYWHAELDAEIDRRIAADSATPRDLNAELHEGFDALDAQSRPHGLPDSAAVRCGNCDEALFRMIGDCPVCGKHWPIEQP